MCSVPVPPEHMYDKGVCPVCKDTIDTAREMIPVLTGDVEAPPRTGFNAILAELRNTATPATIGLAEKILELAGGADGLATTIWDDLKAVRGEKLPPELRDLYTVDHKTVQGYHKLIAGILHQRDELIKGSSASGGLDSLSEEDLLIVAAEAAKLRIAVDAEFRQEMVRLIEESDPDLIESVYMSRFGLPSVKKPSVRVRETVNA
jgi:hypothetical protein